MTGPLQHLPPEDEADLAALADGALFGPRRRAIEARLAVEPELAAALERQRAAVAMLAASTPRAPLSLRMLVEEMEAAQPIAARRRGWRLWPAAALALAVTMAAFVVLVAARGPAVEDVLAVALKPATAEAAVGKPFEGVRFPTYESWRATGERTDVIEGRTVRTLYYESRGRVIAYAIVAGPALSSEGALRAVDGADGVVAVTWTRHGRTCIIAAVGGDADALARLAVW